VGGIREIGQGIPVEGRPGSTVRIRVSQISANTAYARPTGSREAVGAALAAGGVLVTAAALSSLIASRDRIRRGLDDVIAGRASVPAQVLHGSPRRN
jgi:hypothetical protein